MATLFNCNLPEDLYYLVDKHVWLRPAAGGPVTIGINDVARHLAGTIVAVTPKKAGRAVPKGRAWRPSSLRSGSGLCRRR